MPHVSDAYLMGINKIKCLLLLRVIHIMIINRAYKTEIKPNNKQCTLLEKSAGVARFAYNLGLAERISLYKNEKKSLTAIDQHKALCALKKEKFPWMYEVSKCAPQLALVDLDRAFKNFFQGLKQGKKVGFPKFKSKHKSAPIFRLDNINFGITHNTIRLAKIGVVRLKEKEYIPTKNVKYNSLTVSKIAGRWFVSVHVEQDIPKSINQIESVLGVDVGIKTLATCSNGEVFKNNKFLKKSRKKLAHAQKNLSRKKFERKIKKSSNNRKKSILKVQKIYYRIACQRKDAIHKMTSILVKTKPRYLALENLNVLGMMRNHKLAEAIADASFSEIKRQVLYKTSWYGGEVIDVDRFYPSSKLCRICGNLKEDLKLEDRTYICECGHKEDRDLNASINIEYFGINTLSSRGIQACGESIRLLENSDLKAVS
jgi:putative transposase